MRRLLAAVVLSGLLAVPAASAAPTGTAGFRQEGHIFWSSWDGTRSRGGMLTFAATRGVGLAGEPGPVNEVVVAGHGDYYDEDLGVHGFYHLPLQTVAPTAVAGDPLGNSVVVDFEALDSDGQPHRFSFTLSQPRHTALVHPQTNQPGVNVWADPQAAVGEARVITRLGVQRYEYALRGIVDGVPFVSMPGVPCGTPCQFAGVGTFQGLDTNLVAAAP